MEMVDNDWLLGTQHRKTPELTIHNQGIGVKSYREDGLSNGRKGVGGWREEEAVKS